MAGWSSMGLQSPIPLLRLIMAQSIASASSIGGAALRNMNQEVGLAQSGS